jgi:hypothetical protein
MLTPLCRSCLGWEKRGSDLLAQIRTLRILIPIYRHIREYTGSSKPGMNFRRVYYVGMHSGSREVKITDVRLESMLRKP